MGAVGGVVGRVEEVKHGGDAESGCWFHHLNTSCLEYWRCTHHDGLPSFDEEHWVVVVDSLNYPRAHRTKFSMMTIPVSAMGLTSLPDAGGQAQPPPYAMTSLVNVVVLSNYKERLREARTMAGTLTVTLGGTGANQLSRPTLCGGVSNKALVEVSVRSSPPSVACSSISVVIFIRCRGSRICHLLRCHFHSALDKYVSRMFLCSSSALVLSLRMPRIEVCRF